METSTWRITVCIRHWTMDARTSLCPFRIQDWRMATALGYSFPLPARLNQRASEAPTKMTLYHSLMSPYHRDPVPCCAISHNFQNSGILLPGANADNYKRKAFTLSRQKDGRVVTFRKKHSQVWLLTTDRPGLVSLE